MLENIVSVKKREIKNIAVLVHDCVQFTSQLLRASYVQLVFYHYVII